MSNKFKTEIKSLKSIGELKFIIPPYQRPYVWDIEQIEKLVIDFYEAYKRHDDKYYIGTVLTSNETGTNELIDGQQRFTTLWLIAVTFKILKVGSEIENFLKVKGDLRIDFTIRKQIKAYFLTLLEKEEHEKNVYSDSEIEADEYLSKIAKAVTTILQKLKSLFSEDKVSSKPINYNRLCDFGNYIYDKILFVFNVAPKETNLNKLFSVINNSGIQLEQTDILKSLLLKHVKTEKNIYSMIWEACENMNNYFERNVKSLFPFGDWSAIQFDQLKAYNKELLGLDTNQPNDFNNQSQISYKISDIINENVKIGADEQKLNEEYNNDEDSDDIVYCRSILSFNQLLLHTYRIFLKRNNAEDFVLPFHPNNLLKILEPLHKNKNDSKEKKIKEFFHILWEVRFMFDKKVVKWVQKTEDKDSYLTLTDISKNKNNFSRKEKVRNAEAMLQSVLYVTDNYNTRIWLTPFLYHLLYNNEKESLKLLEQVDNNLSLSTDNDQLTTWNQLNSVEIPSEKKLDFEKELQSNIGTGFKHYWFQKLEYILWKLYREKEDWSDENKRKFGKYRIIARNSIEHIYPQHPEFDDELESKYLNSFGNLVLLSVSQNSTYSRKSVNEKREQFFNKPYFDSLKSCEIFHQKTSKPYESAIEDHLDKMIELYKNHYKLDESKKEQTSINFENSNQNNDHSTENTNLNDENNAAEVENETIPNINRNNNVMNCIPGFNHLAGASFIGCYKYLNNNNATRVSLTYGFYHRTNANCQSPGYITVNPNHIFKPVPAGWYFGVNLRIKCQGNAGINNNQVLIANKVYQAFNQKFVIPKYINNYADMGVDFFIVPNLSKEMDQELKKEINEDELGNNIHEETGLNDGNFEEWLNDILKYLEGLYN